MNNHPGFVDLHVHTTFSDSSLTPQEVVALARDKNLAAIAVTDHDCIDGIGPACEAAHAGSVEIVPGVELTAETEDAELHILGLFIDPELEWLRRILSFLHAERRERMCRMIERLNARGVSLRVEDVVALSNSRTSLGRLHLARALMNKKIVSSLPEAFARFIGRDKPCYVKRVKTPPEEAIDIVRQAGGVATLAHPGTARRDDLIPRLVRAGLQAIEVIHTDHTLLQQQHYRRIAHEQGLLISGGSDCHGTGKGVPLLGTVRLPAEVLEQLRACRRT